MVGEAAKELIVGIVLIGLLIVFWNPLGIGMPPAAGTMLALVLLVTFAAFAGLLWRENARDEREDLHRMLAGRVGYLAGAGVLVLGVFVQSVRHHVDPWLVLALVAMIVGKIVGRLYGWARH